LEEVPVQRSISAFSIALTASTWGAGFHERNLVYQQVETTARDTVVVCVIAVDSIAEVTAGFDPQSNDTTVGGHPFRVAYPFTSPPYAETAEWFGSQLINYKGRTFAPYAPMQIVRPKDLAKVGTFRGVPVFAEAGVTPGQEEVIFFAVRPGCVFQKYVQNSDVSNVRGKV
jgi:hypothetical protein